MDFLSNTEWQFIINACISIISISVGVWIAFRRRVDIPISYETLAMEPLHGSEEEVKEILQRIQVSDAESTLKQLCFVTFKIKNYGRDSIKLDDEATPLTIEFEDGTNILDCKLLETEPCDMKVKITLDGEKILLVLPLLDPKESLTLRVLLTEHIDYFPAINVRVPGNKRIVRANNTRTAAELKIIGIVCICAAVFSYWVFFPRQYDLGTTLQLAMIPGLEFLAGVWFYYTGWVMRRVTPYPNLRPSTILLHYLKMLTPGLPGALLLFAILGAGGAGSYALFGKKGLGIFLVLFLGVYAIIAVWVTFNVFAIWWLRLKKKAYNVKRLAIISAIPAVVMLGLWLFLSFELLLHW